MCERISEVSQKQLRSGFGRWSDNFCRSYRLGFMQKHSCLFRREKQSKRLFVMME